MESKLEIKMAPIYKLW